MSDAKIKDEDYQQLKNTLEGAVDTNEANEILETFAGTLATTKKSLKLGLRAKGQHFRKKGDKSWEELYDKLFPNKINTLEHKLTQFNKNQILDWIMEYIKYPIPNREYIKDSLKGGANDGFFVGILASHIMRDINECDELWLKHRQKVHTRFDLFAVPVMGLFFVMTLIVAGMYQGITWTLFTLGGIAGISIFLIMARLSDFKRLARDEQRLIETTETMVMNKYPKELLNVIYNNTQQWYADTYEKDKDLIPEIDPTEDVDFTIYGLMDYIVDDANFEDDFAVRPIPYDNNYLWRWLYKMSGVTFVDVEAWNRLEEEEKQNIRNSKNLSTT